MSGGTLLSCESSLCEYPWLMLRESRWSDEDAASEVRSVMSSRGRPRGFRCGAPAVVYALPFAKFASEA